MTYIGFFFTLKVPISVEAGEISQDWKNCLQLCNWLMEYDHQAVEELSSKNVMRLAI